MEGIAGDHQALAAGALREEPQVGDVFLRFSPMRRRLIHTGAVVGIADEARVHLSDVHTCVTVEGNTNADGSANETATLRKVRTFREADGHRFVRWTEMGRVGLAAA